MVATLGGQPQVVTFALDTLMARGELVREVVVLHLSPENPRIRQALALLSAEFPNDHYQNRPCRFRPLPVRVGHGALLDIRNEAEADVAWAAVHELVATLKAQDRRLHLCIAGGRRVLALLAMSAALLHFGHRDRMWHIYTPDEFLEQAQEGAIMHAGPQDDVRLIQVPLAPWGAYFPQLRQLAQSPPAQVLAAQTRWLDEVERARCRQVLARLTPRQAEVLQAFARSLSPQEVAETLCITLSTVDTHKTVILDECRNAWEFPERTWLDYRFLREKFGPYFG
jgi:CRISPR-associated protein Csx14